MLYLPARPSIELYLKLCSEFFDESSDRLSIDLSSDWSAKRLNMSFFRMAKSTDGARIWLMS